RTEHCSGAFYVNKTASETEIGKLDSELSTCLEGGSCAVCDGIPPPVACIGGLCAPDVSN
ncbi:MAG: hypothetical protein R3B07_37875, partial [Polyangiaceae bacterium]